MLRVFERVPGVRSSALRGDKERRVGDETRHELPRYESMLGGNGNQVQDSEQGE